MDFIRSATVVGGMLGALVGGAATQELISVEMAAAINTAIMSIVALLRFRPGAGASITKAQRADPN